MSNITTRDRFRGCLLGLAAGDALGTTLEFKAPGSFQPIDDMVGGGPFRLNPGDWTDDTSMALCLAASLIESREFNATDQMERYVRWWEEGYLSSTGSCFDIGNTVADALSHFMDTGDPYSGSSDPYSAGNGSLMRLAPVPMYFADDHAEAIDRSADSSRTTHGAEEAIDACRYFAGMLLGALQGVDKETLLSAAYCPVEGLWEKRPLAGKIAAIADGSFKHRDPPDIKGTGCGRLIGGSPLGFQQVPKLSRRRPPGRQPRRRCRHYRRNLRTDRRSSLRSRCNTGRMARTANDDGRDHLNGRQPLRPRPAVQDELGFRYGRRLIRNPPLRYQMAAQLNPLRIDPNHPVT